MALYMGYLFEKVGLILSNVANLESYFSRYKFDVWNAVSFGAFYI